METTMSLGTILLIILILLLIGALPSWPYSSGWGYYPSGGLGLVVIILLILVLMGRLYPAGYFDQQIGNSAPATDASVPARIPVVPVTEIDVRRSLAARRRCGPSTTRDPGRDGPGSQTGAGRARIGCSGRAKETWLGTCGSRLTARCGRRTPARRVRWRPSALRHINRRISGASFPAGTPKSGRRR